MKSSRRVVLVGMGETALSALDSLITTLEVVGVLRPTPPGGSTDDPVIARAKAVGIPLFTDLTPSGIVSVVSALRPDAVVVSSYNRIIKAELLDQFRFVNVHYSPLPRYRGQANVNWALINDEAHTAITIHLMAPALDAGNILFQGVAPIGPDDTVGQLYQRLNALQREHLGPAIQRFLDGESGVPQIEKDASYGCARVPGDGNICWADSTRKIDCFIRALDSPFPGAHTYFEGRKLIIWKAAPIGEARNYVGRVPGRVVTRSAAEGHVDVLTGDGVLRLLHVQADGQQPVAAARVITTVRSTLGLEVQDLLARIQDLEAQLRGLAQQGTPEQKGSGS